MKDWLDILAEGLPHVRPDFIDEVRKMEPMELRRRLLIGSDWQGAWAASLNGIKEIAVIPGGGIDNCRSPDDVRRIVEQLVKECPVTWENSWRGQKKS
jgi:hypothetical protein